MSSEEENCYSDRDSFDGLDNEESDSQWVPPKPSSIKVSSCPFLCDYILMLISLCMYVMLHSRFYSSLLIKDCNFMCFMYLRGELVFQFVMLMLWFFVP